MSLAITQIDEDALAMVRDDEVEVGVFVHIAEGHATPAGNGHLQPERSLRPAALSIAEPDACAFAQSRQGCQIERAVFVDVNQSRRALPNPLSGESGSRQSISERRTTIGKRGCWTST